MYNNMRNGLNTKQAGQTLVETVVGVFVLTIGVSTALGLAVAMFNASSSAVKQVIGAGLAREGMEAVFNMRATNWLKGELSTNCYSFTEPSANNALCHRDWLLVSSAPSTTYNLTPSGGNASYVLDFNSAATDSTPVWSLTPSSSFRLYYDATAASGALYKTTSTGAIASDFYREIKLETQSVAPYSTAAGSIGPRLKVTTRVWWSDRGCPASSTYPTSGKCRIELVTYLTNWRNY